MSFHWIRDSSIVPMREKQIFREDCFSIDDTKTILDRITLDKEKLYTSLMSFWLHVSVSSPNALKVDWHWNSLIVLQPLRPCRPEVLKLSGDCRCLSLPSGSNLCSACLRVFWKFLQAGLYSMSPVFLDLQSTFYFFHRPLCKMRNLSVKSAFGMLYRSKQALTSTIDFIKSDRRQDVSSSEIPSPIMKFWLLTCIPRYHLRDRPLRSYT